MDIAIIENEKYYFSGIHHNLKKIWLKVKNNMIFNIYKYNRIISSILHYYDTPYCEIPSSNNTIHHMQIKLVSYIIKISTKIIRFYYNHPLIDIQINDFDKLINDIDYLCKKFNYNEKDMLNKLKYLYTYLVNKLNTGPDIAISEEQVQQLEYFNLPDDILDLIFQKLTYNYYYRCDCGKHIEYWKTFTITCDCLKKIDKNKLKQSHI